MELATTPPPSATVQPPEVATNVGLREACVAELVPDRERQACVGCCTEFTFFNRRHHCRICGEIFCGKCSDWKVELSWSARGGSRSCRPCHMKEGAKAAEIKRRAEEERRAEEVRVKEQA